MKTIYWHRNLVFGDCGENFDRELAVLANLIVKLMPWAYFPWGVNRPPCQSLAGRWERRKGTSKVFYSQWVSLENIQLPCVWFKFVTPNSLPVSNWLVNERMCSAASLSQVRVGGGGDVALSSLLRAGLSRRLPRSYRTLKQRDDQVKSVVLISSRTADAFPVVASLRRLRFDKLEYFFTN